MIYTHQEVADMLNVSLSSVKNYIKDLKEEDPSIDFNNIDDDIYKKIEDIAIQKNPHVRKFKDLENKINSLNSELSKKEDTINELNETISTMKDNHIKDLRESTHKYLSLQEQSNLLLAQLSSNFKALTDQTSARDTNRTNNYETQKYINDDQEIDHLFDQDIEDTNQETKSKNSLSNNNLDSEINSSGIDLENNNSNSEENYKVSFDNDFDLSHVFDEQGLGDEGINANYTKSEEDKINMSNEDSSLKSEIDSDLNPKKDQESGSEVKVGFLQKLFGRKK